MSEHVFPFDRRRRSRHLLDAVILHHLLTCHPRRLSAGRLAGALAGRTPSGHEVHAVRQALARLARDGLVDLTATAAGASRAAQRFHQLLLSDTLPPPTPHDQP